MMAATITTTAPGLTATLAAVSTVAAPVMAARPAKLHSYGPGPEPAYISAASFRASQTEPAYRAQQAQTDPAYKAQQAQPEPAYRAHQAQSEPPYKAHQAQTDPAYRAHQAQTEPAYKAPTKIDPVSRGSAQKESAKKTDNEPTYRQILPKNGNKLQTLLAESPARLLQVSPVISLVLF